MRVLAGWIAFALVATGCGSSDSRPDASDASADARPDAPVLDGARPDRDAWPAEMDAMLPVVDPCEAPGTIEIDHTVFGMTMGGSATEAPPDYSRCFGGGGADGAFRFVATDEDPVVFTSNADFDEVLSIRTSCGDETSVMDCADAVHMTGGERIKLYPTPGETYYVMVDGYRGRSVGQYSVRAEHEYRIVGLGETCNRRTLICDGEFGCDAETHTCIREKCENITDDDGDDGRWRIDCHDDDCVDTPACEPGDGALLAGCDRHSDCAGAGGFGPLCLNEFATGYPNGICAAYCDMYSFDGPGCPAGFACGELADRPFTATCLPTCEVDTDCPAGKYHCVRTRDEVGVCHPYCDTDDDCPKTHNCNGDTRRCGPPEQCANGTDDDGDRLVDCEDNDCAPTELCVEGRAAACMGAQVAMLGMNMGSTADASRYFSAPATSDAYFCANESGPEDVWRGSFGEAGEAGVLFAWLHAIPNHVMYLRRGGCDGVENITCIPPYVIGDQTFELEYTGGETIYFFIDAEGAEQVGPYGLELRHMVLDEAEPNDRASNATAYGDEGQFGGRILPSGDVDFVRVHVPENGSTVTVSIDTLGGYECRAVIGRVDPQLELFAADGTTSLAFGDDKSADDFCPVITATGLAAGDYLVRVSYSEAHGGWLSESGFATFSYLLDVQVTR